MIPLFHTLTPKTVKNQKVPCKQILQKLDLRKNTFTEDLVKYLTKFLEANKSLQELKFSSINFLSGASTKQLCQSLMQNTGLKNLDLGSMTDTQF